MSYTLFCSGQKPAYLCNSGVDQSQYKALMDRKTPFTLLLVNTVQMVLFFAHERIKQRFEDQVKHLEINSPDYHQLIGEVLGYPPQAAAFYARCMENPNLQDYQASYHYAGMRFVGHIDHKEKIAAWCWSRVPVAAEPLDVSFQGKSFTLFPK